MKNKKLFAAYGKATAVFNSPLSWDKKYEIIFSKEIAASVNIDYYDPDTDCEDDTRAFMRAFDIHIQNLINSLQN